MTANSSGEAKWWESADNPEVIRSHAEDWSLAGDAAIAVLLNKFSQQISTKTDALVSKLDDLVQNTAKLEVDILNCDNSFTMLSQTQFMESRTYMDDDRPAKNIEKADPPVEEKTSSELQSDALSKGLVTLGLYYNKIVVSDSEDESDNGSDEQCTTTLYTLNNPNLVRPLPHIIMSREFMSDPLVGLAVPEPQTEEEEEDLSSSYDEDIGDANIFDRTFKPTSSRLQGETSSESEYMSETSLPADRILTDDSQSDLKATVQRALPTVTAVQKTLPTGRQRPVATVTSRVSPETDSDEEFFRPVSTFRNNILPKDKTPNPAPSPVVPNTIADEISNRFKSSRLAQQAMSSSDSDDDLFKAKPPPLSSVANVRALPEKKVPTISQPNPNKPAATTKPLKSIFSSDTEEDDLFGRIPPPIVAQPPEKSISANDSEDDFNFSSKETSKYTLVENTGPRVPVGGVNIFSSAVTASILKPKNSERNEVPEEGKESENSEESKPSQTKQKPASLFDDEDEDGFFVIPNVPPAKVTVPPAKVTVPPAKVTVPPAKVTVPPAKVTVPPTKVTVPPAKVTAHGLFSSDDEDLFNSIVKSKDVSQHTYADSSKMSINKEVSSLTTSDVSSSKSPPKSSAGNVSKPNDNVKTQEVKNIPKVTPKTTTGLFSSSSDENLFSSADQEIRTNSKSLKPAVISPNTEESISKTSKEPPASKVPIIPISKPVSSSTVKSSLFDSSSEEDFLASPPPKEDKNESFMYGSSDEDFPVASHAIDYDAKRESSQGVEIKSQVIDKAAESKKDSVISVTESKAGAKPNLFMSDDEDIFRESLLKAPVTVKSTLENTKLEDEEDIFNFLGDEGKEKIIEDMKDGGLDSKDSPEESEEVKPVKKKPIGGVALFPSSELLSKISLRKTDGVKNEDAEVKRESPKVMKKPVGGVALFPPPQKMEKKTTTSGDDTSSEISTSSPEVKKKPPVGGIALFGGAELQAKLRKRRGDSDDERQTVSASTTPTQLLSPTSPSNKSVVNKFLTSHRYSAPTLGSGMSGKQAVVMERGSSFENEPVVENVLPSVNKERPKGNQQRRPPSRLSMKRPRDYKNNRSGMQFDDADSSPVTVDAGSSPVTIDAGSSPVTVDAGSSPVTVDADSSPVTVDADSSPVTVDAVSSPEKVNTDNNPVKVNTDNNPVKVNTDINPAVIEDKTVKDDRGSSDGSDKVAIPNDNRTDSGLGSLKSENSSPQGLSKNSDGTEIISKSSKLVFSSSEDDEDLFGAKGAKEVQIVSQTISKSKPEVQSEDLFKNVKTPPSQTKGTTDLFADEDSDEDLFSSLASTKPIYKPISSTSKPVSSTVPPVDKAPKPQNGDLFDDPLGAK